MSKKMNILLISGLSPNSSAGLGNSIIKSLTDRGHTVDFITKYKFDKMDSNMYSVYDKFERKSSFFYDKIVPICVSLKQIIKKNFFKTKYTPTGKYMSSFDERRTWVESDLLLSKLSDKYDLVLVLFWFNMVTTKTLYDIFQKLGAPILLCVVDMLPMTGGCHYFGDCKRYLDTCGACPGCKSKVLKDYTYHNFIYKKTVYNSINYYYGGNTWLQEYATQSPMIDDKRIKELYLPINENIFKVRDQQEIRRKMNFDQTKKFILFAGAALIEEERKGFKYLIEALNLFYDSLDIEKRSDLLLVLAGKAIEESKLNVKIDTIQLGFVGEKVLADLYSACDCFLCSSIDDAGPTMINQSIMCGTPVVSFDIGIAKDIVINGETGYKVEIGNSVEFSNMIKNIYELSIGNRNKMKETCRKIAIAKYSLSAFSNRVEAIYNEIQ